MKPNPRSIAMVVIICVSLSGLAQQTNKPNASAGILGAASGPDETERELWKLKSVDGDAAKVQRELHSKIESLVQRKNFQGLDQLADELRTSKKHTSDGSWHLRQFYLVFSFDTQQDTREGRRKARLAFLQSWADTRKESITARVALASSYTTYAWYARGTGFADSVSEEGWRLFKERLEMARHTLLEAQKLKSKCPSWWDYMQLVALAQSWDMATYDKVFNEATALEPDYTSYYTRKVIYLLPRWHGKEGDWQQFATRSADKLGGEAGDILYARLGWFVHNVGCYDGFLKDAGYSWPRMKKGLEAIVKKYPESNSAANELAYLAWQAKDKNCARPLFERIGNTPDAEVWSLDLDRYLRAKTWALSN